MKQTLITLLALGGLAGAESSGSLLPDSKNYQFTSTIDKFTEGTSGGSYNGLQFCLSDALDAERLTLSPTVGEIPSSFVLDSFGFQVRGGASHNGLWAAVLDKSNVVIGISTSAASSSGLGMLTFNFSGVQLSSTETYKIVGMATKETLTLNSTAGASFNNSRPFSIALSQTGTADDAASLGQLASGNINSLASKDYMPYVEIRVSTAPIPEPATATLSLLALCGLAARRRRK